MFKKEKNLIKEKLTCGSSGHLLLFKTAIIMLIQKAIYSIQYKKYICVIYEIIKDSHMWKYKIVPTYRYTCKLNSVIHCKCGNFCEMLIYTKETRLTWRKYSPLNWWISWTYIKFFLKEMFSFWGNKIHTVSELFPSWFA